MENNNIFLFTKTYPLDTSKYSKVFLGDFTNNKQGNITLTADFIHSIVNIPHLYINTRLVDLNYVMSQKEYKLNLFHSLSDLTKQGGNVEGINLDLSEVTEEHHIQELQDMINQLTKNEYKIAITLPAIMGKVTTFINFINKSTYVILKVFDLSGYWSLKVENPSALSNSNNRNKSFKHILKYLATDSSKVLLGINCMYGIKYWKGTYIGDTHESNKDNYIVPYDYCMNLTPIYSDTTDNVLMCYSIDNEGIVFYDDAKTIENKKVYSNVNNLTGICLFSQD